LNRLVVYIHNIHMISI